MVVKETNAILNNMNDGKNVSKKEIMIEMIVMIHEASSMEVEVPSCVAVEFKEYPSGCRLFQ